MTNYLEMHIFSQNFSIMIILKKFYNISKITEIKIKKLNKKI